MLRQVVALVVLVMVAPKFLAAPNVPQTKEEAGRKAELLYAQRMAQASEVVMAAPFYSLSGSESSTLYLMNTGMLPVLAEIRFYPDSGEVLSGGEFLLEPRRHFRLLLSEIPRLRLTSGAIEIRYLGDTDLVQGWLVQEKDGQVVELPIQHVVQNSTRDIKYSVFWGHEAGRLRLWAFNPTSAASELSLTLTSPTERSQTAKIRLEGHSGRDLLGGISIPANGWLVLQTLDQTEPILMPLVSGPTSLLRLPVISAPMSTTKHLALRWPSAEETYLSLLNPGIRATSLNILALDRTGKVVASSKAKLARSAVTPLVLEDLLPQAESLGAMRLELSAEEPFEVNGYAIQEQGSQVEIQFFPADKAHGGGTYPLPDLSTNRVVTTLVNVGTTPQRVVGQVFWEGGEYALDGMIIEAGATLSIDFEQLVASGSADILGRKLSPELPDGFFKWTAVSGGSHQLLGRTEAFPNETRGDVFGFNCWGCCFQLPYGRIVPAPIELNVGQAHSLEACFEVNTCSGNLGPYLAYVTSTSVPSPFTWNGQTASASDGASATLSFAGLEEETKANCVIRDKPIGGNGKASSCRNKYLGNLNEGTSCHQQTTTCGTCCACAYAKFRYWDCEHKDPNINNSEYSLDKTNCATSKCNDEPCPVSQFTAALRDSEN